MIKVNDSPVMTQEFHLSVQTQMKQVNARILPPPELRYASRTVRVNRGVWQSQQFNRASNLENNSWTILNVSFLRNDDALERLQVDLRDTGKVYSAILIDLIFSI